jgi:stringent starvation protein B
MRALYEWILENQCTPHVLVNALADQVQVPQQYVKNGQIVLNVSPVAVMDLLIADEAMSFNGRFGGVPMDVYVPMSAVMGIYARENGQGMIFEPEEDGTDPEPPKGKPEKKVEKKTGRPSLKVVK